jgi:hypothetical protein
LTSFKDKVLIALYLEGRLLFYSCTKTEPQWTSTDKLPMKVDIKGHGEHHLSFKDDLIYSRLLRGNGCVMIDMQQMINLGLENISSSSPAIFIADIKDVSSAVRVVDKGKNKVILINKSKY